MSLGLSCGIRPAHLAAPDLESSLPLVVKTVDSLGPAAAWREYLANGQLAPNKPIVSS